MVTGLDFENSAKTLPVPNKGISHAEYFLQKKVALQFPDAKPMILVEGRRKMTIYLPPELVAGIELVSCGNCHQTYQNGSGRHPFHSSLLTAPCYSYNT